MNYVGSLLEVEPVDRGAIGGDRGLKDRHRTERHCWCANEEGEGQVYG